MQVRAWLRCAVATTDSNSCFYATIAVMSEILPLSSIIFLPFLTFIELHQEMITSLTAVIIWMSNHETYWWTVHLSLCMSRLTNCTLLGYSINTDCSTTKFMELGVSKLLSQTHYCVTLWVLMNFFQVQYIIVIESVTVSVSLDTYTIIHMLFVFFNALLYSCDNHYFYYAFTSTLPSKFKLCVASS